MRISFAMAAFVAGITLAWRVEAAECGPTERVIGHLHSKYGETRRAVALANTREPMIAELYVAATGTWTLVYTHPSGISCIKASGTAWEFVTDPPVAPPTTF